jgi:carnitine-CoA ligase
VPIEVWSAGETRTIPQLLRERAASDPDSPFLEFDAEMHTAAELDASSDRIAGTLARLGVEAGDRVAFALGNCVEFATLWFGVMKLGAVVVPLNTALKGASLRHQLADSGAKVLALQGDLAARVADAAAALDDLACCITVGEPDGVLPVRTLTWVELELESDPPPETVADPEGLACILYTSGTTGQSKGCMISHASLIARSWRGNWCVERTADDVLFTPLPLFHVNALIYGFLGPLLFGGRSCIDRRFSVSRFWPEIRRTGATIATLMGALATLIAHAPDDAESDGSSLERILAVPMPREIDTIWRERFGVAVISGMYGQTEATPLGMTTPGVRNPAASVGRANDIDFDVRIFDDHDREVAHGEVGEIVCRPRHPFMMYSGYWRAPEATARAARNLWYHTGDLGKVDDDGFLYFVDRKQDYLRRRGENISSVELEMYFLTHDDVAEVAVHAVPCELGEDEVKLTAVLNDGATVTAEELVHFAVNGLPFFAVPRFIEFRTELPRNQVGRVQKAILRSEGVTPQTWDREAAGVVFERR